MKVSLRFIFVILILFSIPVFPQNTTTLFPFGAYVGLYHGIRDGMNLNSYDSSTQGANFSNWNNWMGINNHLVEFRGGQDGIIGDFYDPVKVYAEWLGANGQNYADPILVSTFWRYNSGGVCFEGHGGNDLQPGFTMLSEGHYLFFDHATAGINQNIEYDMIVLNSQLFSGDLDLIPHILDSGGFSIYNDASSTVGAKIINNIQIKGTEWQNNKFTNYHSIRPRNFNTRQGSSTTPDTAVFYLSFEIESSGTNPSNDILSIELTNQHGGNAQDPLIIFPNGNEIQISTGVSVLPFYIVVNTSGNNNAPYEFGPKLEVNATLTSGANVIIRNIKIYDEMGKAVVEDDYLGSNPEGYTKAYNYDAILTSAYNYFTNFNKRIIIHLCDESVVGNFAVMKTIREYIENNMSSPYFYVTTPEGMGKPLIRRLFKELGVSNLYVGVDPYKMETNDDYSYPTYINNLIDLSENSFSYLLKEVRNVASEAEFNSSKPYLYSIPQAHAWGSLRAPTEAEMITEGYISLLNNYKGILYYNINVQAGYKTIYEMYNPQNSQFPTLWDFVADSSNVVIEAKNALHAVSSFLNTPIRTDQSQTQGDYILESDLTDFAIVGLDDSYDQSQHYRDLDLGNIGKAKLIRCDIINGTTGEILDPNEHALLGIGYFEKNENANFLISNLDHDLEEARVRLSFKTEASDFLKVTDLTNDNSVNGRIYPANGKVFLTIPAKGSVILEVKNADVSGSSFPKGLRFGVARVQGNNTKIILDNNFNTAGGSAEEVEFTVPGTNNKFFWTDYDEDGILDLGVYFYEIELVGSKLNFLYSHYRIYSQDENGDFSIIYSSDPVNVYSISIADPYPLVAVNNGITNFGYALKDLDNSRFIVKSSTTQYYGSPYYSSNSIPMLGKWNGEYSICFYSNGTFYYDKNNDDSLEAVASMSLNNNKPILGDWYGDDDYEYGLYASNNFYGLGFLLNNSGGTDGYSYFEFPYGNPGDIPIVWQPNPSWSSTNKNGISEEEREIELTYSLGAYPNPFNPTATISYTIPERTEVNIKIYNILGQEVALLVNKEQDAGEYKVQFNAENFSSGVYLCRMQTSNYVKTHKLLLLK